MRIFEKIIADYNDAHQQIYNQKMYNQNPKREIFSHLFYEDPKGGWEYCSVAWVNGELAYYSPLLPNADPIPPIPFRLGNGSNRYWENYMLDTGVRHPDKIKDLIKKYDFATVKYDKYQVIPSTEYNIQRLERLLTAQFSLWSTAGEKEFNDSLKTRTTKTKEQQNQETKLKDEGYFDIKTIGSDKQEDKATYQKMASISSENNEKQCRAIAAAKRLTAAEFDLLKEKDTNPKATWDNLALTSICLRYFVEENESVDWKLVDLDRRGFYSKAILAFHFLNQAKSIDYDTAKIAAIINNGVAVPFDVQKATLQKKVALLHKLKIEQFLETGKQWDSQSLSDWFENTLIPLKHEVKDILRLSITDKSYPVATLQDLLRKMGTELKSTRKKGQARIYSWEGWLTQPINVLEFFERYAENHKVNPGVPAEVPVEVEPVEVPADPKADIDTAINSTDIDKNTVKLAEKQVFNKVRLLYDCTIGYSYLPSKQNEKMANRSHDRRYSPHTAYLYRLGKINLIRKILSEVDLTGGYSEDSLATWFARWQSSDAKNQVASYLKIRIGDSPVKFLNAVLKKLGLKATGKRVRTGNILATRYSVEYPADFPLTDLMALFARWHESDRLRYGGSHLSDNAILESIESFIFVRDTV